MATQNSINRNPLRLYPQDSPFAGVGAAYVRVSDDQQETARQYAALQSFEKRAGVTIQKQHWFEDQGWARDTADRRPDFQRLLKLAEQGTINWIVVADLDRFGVKNPKQLIAYLYRLEEARCRLFDSSGREWTGEDVAQTIVAVVEGEKSKGEQIKLSGRVLGGKVVRARRGEWQGGPVRLGFDVACYSRTENKELWRVVTEARDKRLKVYPDGTTQRYDGKGNFPSFQKEGPEYLRLVPTRDKAKLKAAVSVFERYASESITTTALARYLNELGFRNGMGGYFQPNHIEGMLRDPVYLGYYCWNKRHFGKFNRFTGDQVTLEYNYSEQGSENAPEDWVQSERLFAPLVDQRTWSKVQEKFANTGKRGKAPISPKLYLSGLVVCGNCGARMVAGPVRKPRSKTRKDGTSGERYEYFCGTYHKAAREKRVGECQCLRNGIFHDVLEGYVERWLVESGKRLSLLTDGLGNADLIRPLQREQDSHFDKLLENIDRLADYLAKHHAAEYTEVVERYNREPGHGHDLIEALIETYQHNFNPKHVEAELQRLDAEHDALMQRSGNFSTPRAKAKATKELEAVE